MKRNLTYFFVFVFCCSSTFARAEKALKSTLDDQEAVEVTIYNNNLGLIKDTRKIDLPKGEGELRFMDVAAHIMPVTVHIKSLDNPETLSVLEQNYEYDLMNANKLMDKYVGQKIKLVDRNIYHDKSEVIEAELLSNNNGQIYKINGEIHLGHPGYKILPKIPENLIAKPTLSWLYANRTSKPHRVEVSYLTNNINWKADYIVVLDQEDRTAGVSGWVTLDNKSGTTYKDAKLKLIAGEINRVMDGQLRRGMFQAKAAMAMEDISGFVEKAFFEYHIYNLQRKTTIKDNQTKQVSLLEADDVHVDKEYMVQGQAYHYINRYQQQDKKVPVNVHIKFKNEEKNNLGMPLPAGIMRIYKEDDEKSLQFVGEDRVDHTPKDEKVRLKLGKAFDVVAERVQTHYRRLGQSRQIHQSEWEVTLRNHKDEDVTVTVVEPMPENWEILYATHSYEKVNAFTLKFEVKVPKDKEVKLVYQVEANNSGTPLPSRNSRKGRILFKNQ